MRACRGTADRDLVLAAPIHAHLLASHHNAARGSSGGSGGDFAVEFDMYRTIVGHPGKPGELNDYGVALTRAMSQLDSSLGDSACAWARGAGDVAAAALVARDAADGKVLRAHALLDALRARALAAGGGVPCAACGMRFASLAELYDYRHACVDEPSWLEGNRK